MSEGPAASPIRKLIRLWPWGVLALAVIPAVWHVVDFPSDIDPEAPGIVRPTFSPLPPAAYRLADTGDTMDNVAIDFSAAAVLLAGWGFLRRRGAGLWPAAMAASIGAYWYAATPGPSLDGWYGLGWRSIADPHAPWALRLGLAMAALALLAVIVRSFSKNGEPLARLVERARARRNLVLLVSAMVLIPLRQVEIPGLEPARYWPRWALIWGMLAFDLALVRALAPGWVRSPQTRPRTFARRCVIRLGACAVVWWLLTAGAFSVVKYHQPLRRLKESVPGRIFICALPTYEGLELAQRRHHFKTIINLFPENTQFRSPHLADEIRFAREHNIRYVGNPGDKLEADAFMDETLALARDPAAWPILVHCHGCHDRTPAWLGIYRFVIEGRPLDEILREIEQHRGSRPKGSVTVLYNRLLPIYAHERYALDPTAPLLQRCEAAASHTSGNRATVGYRAGGTAAID
jgi:hypothetical protein